MNYVKNKQLGYNKEQTIIVPIDNNDIYNHRNQFKINCSTKAILHLFR